MELVILIRYEEVHLAGFLPTVRATVASVSRFYLLTLSTTRTPRFEIGTSILTPHFSEGLCPICEIFKRKIRKGTDAGMASIHPGVSGTR